MVCEVSKEGLVGGAVYRCVLECVSLSGSEVNDLSRSMLSETGKVPFE